jgi:P27 family predicted phage terminase small subunit
MTKIKLKPARYLTPRGREIFEELSEWLEGQPLESVDAFELSTLAQYYDMYETSARIVNQEGYSRKMGVNGYEQVTPHFTAMKDALDKIMKLSYKFGLNPSAREKIKSFNQAEDNKPSTSDEKLRQMKIG